MASRLVRTNAVTVNRQIRCVTKGVFRTAVDRDNDGVVINAFYRHSRIKIT